MGFKTSGPYEAMIVTGCMLSQPLMIPGGRVWVWPCQQLQRISLKTMTLQIHSTAVNTSNDIPISCIGIVQARIQGQNQEMLANACEQFLGKPEEEIHKFVLEILEGHQAAVIGNMGADEVYRNRPKFAKQVFEMASSDLVKVGITVVSYTLKDVTDDEGYFAALRKIRIAQMLTEAKTEEEEARQNAEIQEAIAHNEQLENDIKIAKSKQDDEVQKSTNDTDVEAKLAEFELARDMQAASENQPLKEDDVQS